MKTLSASTFLGEEPRATATVCDKGGFVLVKDMGTRDSLAELFAEDIFVFQLYL